MSALSQQYDQAQYQLSQINSSIATTKANVAADQQQVAKNKATLSKAAVANYITDGTASAQNPIFSGNEQTLGATTEYNKIAEGDISLAVDNLHTAEHSLNTQETQLQGEQSQAQTQVTTEQNAVAQNAQAIQSQKSALSQEQGQIATLVQQQEQAEAAAAAQAAQQKPTGSRSSRCRRRGCSRSVFRRRLHGGSRSQRGCAPALLPRWSRSGAGGRKPGRRALRLGRRVPQGLGQPRLRLLGAHGVVLGSGRRRPLPHYSGAQMADSTPVPVSDLEPGDLLFYGPGGSEHVAMYVGPGTMIEAPYTGAVGLGHRPPPR